MKGLFHFEIEDPKKPGFAHSTAVRLTRSKKGIFIEILSADVESFRDLLRENFCAFNTELGFPEGADPLDAAEMLREQDLDILMGAIYRHSRSQFTWIGDDYWS